jgi:hypothetical protein
MLGCWIFSSHQRRRTDTDILGVPNTCPGWLRATASDQVRLGRSVSLLDECAIGRIAESCSAGPYHLDASALQQGEPVPVGLVGEQDGEADGWLVEAAVVVQLRRPLYPSARFLGLGHRGKGGAN